MLRRAVLALGFVVITACEWGGGTDATGLIAHDAMALAGDSATLRDAFVQKDAPVTLSCTMSFTGVVATWDFTGAAGSQASTAASMTAPGVTAGAISRAAGLTPSTRANSISSTGWPTSATLDLTKYYTMSITAPAGCSLDLTSLAIDAAASATGPQNAAAATDADTFTQTVTISLAAPSTPTVSATSASGSIEIRIYGYAAGNTTSGTMRLQNTLSVSGSVQ